METRATQTEPMEYFMHNLSRLISIEKSKSNSLLSQKSIYRGPTVTPHNSNSLSLSLFLSQAIPSCCTRISNPLRHLTPHRDSVAYAIDFCDLLGSWLSFENRDEEST